MRFEEITSVSKDKNKGRATINEKGRVIPVASSTDDVETDLAISGAPDVQ